MKIPLPCVLTVMILLTTLPFLPGCVTNHDGNITAIELRTRFLDSADNILDYRSEYSSGTDGEILFEWKKPSNYRMEYLTGTSIAPGTILLMNKTMAVRYDAGGNTYRIEPDNGFLLQHDYQAMVQEIVRNEDFSVIGTRMADGRTLYGIEIVTEPWSDRYTIYISSRIQAWIDPESGLAWNITTFYPSDTANNFIRYDRIDVNTGIPESRFSFSPPPGSGPQCGNSGRDLPEDIDYYAISPALRPGCMECTNSLLNSPIGGFSGDRFLVSLFDYDGPNKIPDPDPSRSVNYTFYARDMEPGTVSYRIWRVAGLYETEPLPLPEDFTVTVEPDEFTAEPGGEYTSTVTVRLRQDSDDYIWLYMDADVEGAPDAVTDDWVRVAVNDGSPLSGAGLYHFHQGAGGYCQDLIVVPQGGSGHAQFYIGTGELDTGTVSVNLTTMPCNPDHGPIGADERPAWPEGIRASIDPDRFTARSFADYYVGMSFSVAPSVELGDYCFGAQLRTPTGGFDFAPFTLRVIESEG